MSQHVRDKAIIALLTHPTLGKAAAAIGVNEKTLHRWLKEDDFTQQLESARREMYLQSLNMCHAAQCEVIQGLLTLARGAKSEAVRLGAYRALREDGIKTYETFDLERRIAALEALNTEQRQ